MNLVLYVDDGFVTDDGTPASDREIEMLNDAFRDEKGADGITIKEPDHFWVRTSRCIPARR